MIVLISDGNHCISRSVLSGGDQHVTYLKLDSPSFPAALESILKRDDLDLMVIECHVNEKSCLPLISTTKKRRMDIPVLFITSTDTDYTIAEAFRRGARDCFRNPFDLKILKERIRTLRSFKNGPRSMRIPMAFQVDQSLSEHILSSTLPENMIKVLQFMDNHLADAKITVDRLARIAGMSHYHFCRTFKKHAGHSPMQFLRRLRIEQAKKLLKYHSKSMSISEIATAVGFYDASNFNRHFKRLTGFTPTHFARSINPSP
jgi:AraC-like DNA-binding protein/CheY-like chemotaxis protein